MKKMISILLSVALFLSVFPVSVFAAGSTNENTESGYTYTVENGEATITGCDDSITGDVVLPDTLGGYPVRHIGDYAFTSCKNLTEIYIPHGVTSIGMGAFNKRTDLLSIEIPDSVTNIERYAFDDCLKLEKVYYGADIETWCNIKFSGSSSNPLNGGGTLYINGVAVRDLVIPDTIEKIETYAFNGCSCSSIKIPDSVKSIGYGAFENCISLTSIKIPDSVTGIGASAFKDCNSLTSIEIPDSVKSIGYGAFENCSSLTSVKIPDSVTSIGASTFKDCNSLTSIEIPDSVISIGLSTFEGCSSLTSVKIPDSVKSIDGTTFEGCSSLTSIEIPDSVTYIGACAFLGCSSLTNIEIPDSVTSIGDYAFRNCTGLTDVKIPNSVTSIGKDAFPSKITILCTNNSVAYTYALRYKIKYELYPYINLPIDVLYVGDTNRFTVVSEDVVKVQWYSSNPEVISIDSSGNVTALSEGEVLITAVISGYTEEDYIDTCLITVKPVYHVYYVSAGKIQLPEIQKKMSGKALGLSSYKPTRSGYSFEGWSTEPNDTTVEYQPIDIYTEDADLTLYAVWKWIPKCSACDGTGQKRVSCQECDGDGYTTVKTSRTCTICSGKGTVKQTYTVKEEHTCPICHGELVTWSDSLHGWVPCRGCNGLGTVTVEVEKEKNVTCITCNGAGKLYSTSTKTCSTCLGVGYKKVRCTRCGGDGICTQDSFGVSYDPNGGTGAPASQTKEKASSLTLSKDIPVKDGYIFCGWSTSVGGSVKYQPGDIYSADQDLILVAVWQKEPEPIPGYSCGDIDNNGTINLKDVTQLQKYLAGWDVEVATEYCDVNADGEINLKDVTHLQKYLAGWEVKLGQS